MRGHGPLLVALALAACGVKAPPRPAASSGVAPAADGGAAAPAPATPAAVPCDAGNQGSCGR